MRPAARFLRVFRTNRGMVLDRVRPSPLDAMFCTENFRAEWRRPLMLPSISSRFHMEFLLENVTIERRGRKGRKERQHLLCGLRGLCVQAQRLMEWQDLCLPRDHDGIGLKRSRSGLTLRSDGPEPWRRGPDQAAKA